VDTVRTVVDVIRGKDVLLKDAPLQALPRVGETLKIRSWDCEVLRIEHLLSDPQVHVVRIFVRST